MNGKLKMPDNLKSSALQNLARTAMTRKSDVAGEVIYVDPDECYFVHNPRKQFNPELIEVYTHEFLDPNQGQREACTVYPKDDKGYRVYHGATRTLAGRNAKKIKPDWKLKVQIDQNLVTRSDFENYWEQGTNNIIRDNMSVFDQADWLAESINLAKAEGKKLTQTDIAKRLAMSKAQVSRLMSLQNAAPEIKEVYFANRTQDPETLSNLIKIQQTNPELFSYLTEKTELDRATVREAAKTGLIPEITSHVTSDENTISAGVGHNPEPVKRRTDAKSTFEYFVAHAQQEPLAGVELSSGKCYVLTLDTENGFQAAATTVFEHDHNLLLDDNQINTWSDRNMALKQAYQNLIEWANRLESHTGSVTEDQLDDARLVRDYLSLQGNQEESSGPEKGQKVSRPTNKKSIVTCGTWNGQDCTLVTSLDNKTIVELGNIISEADSEGAVYIRLENGELKKINPEEFHLKSVKITD